MMKRRIPSSGEMLPVVGLGTWAQFDVGPSEAEREPLRGVLRMMAAKGAEVIDSSPMYGRSEAVVGDLASELGLSDKLFYATKVWTSGREAGIRQMESSMAKMRRARMDLMQVHNLVDWQTHLETLRDWKKEGKVRYIGVTHYLDSAHPVLERMAKEEEIDFIQVNYSIRSRNAERSLLDAAMDNGVAVIVNRPFGEGSLFGYTRGRKLPDWASDYGIGSWAQFFLKYLLSHPAVTCVIPGTSRPENMLDNLGAAEGPLPDEKARLRMAEYVERF